MDTETFIKERAINSRLTRPLIDLLLILQYRKLIIHSH